MADKQELTREQKDDLLREARSRSKKAIDFDRENKAEAVEDQEFLEGKNQWTADAKAARNGRPCVTINKLPANLDQLEGEQRQSRIAINVHPVDSKGDIKTAKIIKGLIRNIEYVSKAHIAYNTAYSGAAGSGYGAFRIITDYVSDDSFDQEILIKEIENPLSVEWDPAAKELDRSDAMYCFIYDDMDRDAFKEEYPDITPIDFEKEKDGGLSTWSTNDTVRVAEYFRKKPVKKTIYLLEDGTTVNKLEDGQKAKKTREATSYTVEWYKITGNDVIEGPKVIPGKYIPVIPVWGKKLNVNGVRKIRGLVRNAKDVQRIYNYERSQYIESVALTPKTPYLLTPDQIAGHEKSWKASLKEAFAYLLYNPDKKAPWKPSKEQATQVPAGHAASIAIADKEFNDTTGVPEAMRGVKSNERSGRALIERNRQGATGSFVYIDNLVIAIEHAGRVIVDMIPYYYDSSRVIRIMDEKDVSSNVIINEEFTDKDGNKILYDFSVGKYDVTVKVGSSYETQRLEASDSMTAFINAAPNTAPYIIDLVAETSDWPGAEKIAERLKKILPPELRDDEDGTPPPPPADSGAQPSPSPLDELKVAQEAEKLKGLQLDNQIKEVKLNQEEGRIKELVAAMVQEGKL